MLLALLMTGAVLVAEDPDGVVATARPTTPLLVAAEAPTAPEVGSGAAIQAVGAQDLTTAEQIDRWISSRTPGQEDAFRDAEPKDDRKVHGVVDVGVGTGGYRSYGAAVSMPIGENGRLALSYRQTEGEGLYGSYGPYDPYGRGYGWTGDAFFDDSGYAFPGRYVPGQASRFDIRTRPGSHRPLSSGRAEQQIPE